MCAAEPFLLNPDNRALLEGRVSYKHLAKDDSEKKMGFLALFIVVGIIASTFMIGYAISEWSTWAALRNGGVQTQGTITGRHIDTSGDSDSYHVEYTYQHTPANGDPRAYSGSDKVDYSVYAGAEQGRSIVVLYTPDDPTVSTLDIGLSPPWLITGFSLVWIPGFLGIPLFVMGMFMRQSGIARRLRQGSRKLMGEILYCARDIDDGDCHIKLTYRFQSPQSGQILESTHQQQRDDLIDVEAAKLPSAGTPVVVLYRDDTTFRVL
jgi:hypothetical protein